MNFTIRKYQDGDPSDFKTVTEFYRQAFAWQPSDSDFRAAMSTGVTLLAQDSKDEIVSFAMTNITKGQPYVWGMATTEEWRGNGMARDLLAILDGYYQDLYSFIWLHVDRDNPAQKVYFDCGYRIQSIAKDYYGEQEHGLVMVKRYK